MNRTSSAAKSRVKAVRDRYLELATEWRPRPIRSAQEYDRAAEVLERLAVRPERSLDPGERDYLDAVSAFIEAYDARHLTPAPKGSSVTRLRSLVEAAGMSVSDLGQVLGSQPLASMLLSGKRTPSKAAIAKLSAHFRLDAGYFM